MEFICFLLGIVVIVLLLLVLRQLGRITDLLSAEKRSELRTAARPAPVPASRKQESPVSAALPAASRLQPDSLVSAAPELPPVPRAVAAPAASPEPQPVSPVVKKVPNLSTSTQAKSRVSSPEPYQPSAFELRMEQIMTQVGDWFAVRGRFRPAGVSAEYAVATAWLIRTAVLVLVAGAGFFLRYSYVHGLIPFEIRVLLVVVAGIAMVTGGIRLLRGDYRPIGVGILGGGFAMLYFAVFSAFSLYKLCDASVAMGASIAVTAVAILLAVRLNLMTVALVGTLGGFLAPLLFSSGQKNLPGLFGYLLLLGFGILCAARYRSWKLLNFMAFFFTWLLTGAALWRHCDPTLPADYWWSVGFLFAFFLLYSLLPVTFNWFHRLPIRLPELLLTVAGGGLLGYYGVTLTLAAYSARAAAAVPGCMALAYVVFLQLGLRREQRDKVLLLTWFTLGSAALALAFALLLGRHYVTLAWVVQAVAMYYLSRRTDSDFLRFLALLLYALAGIRFLTVDLEPNFLRQSLWAENAISRFLSLGAFVGGGWGFAAFFRRRAGEEETDSAATARRTLLTIFAGIGVVGTLVYLTVELYWLLKYNVPAALAGGISALWGVYALLALFAGMVVRLSALRRFALGLFALTAVKVMVLDLAGVNSIYRVLALVIIGLALLGGAFLYIRFKDRFEATK